jgi:hypothetical protein
LEVLQPIWLEKPETARRVRQRIRSVFDWSLAKHYRETMNPVDAVRQALPKQPKRKGHHAALPYFELPAFLDDLKASDSGELVKRGLENERFGSWSWSRDLPRLLRCSVPQGRP